MIQVLCHELYHRYQHYQVNLLQAIRDNSDTAKYANLLLLDTAGIYEDEYSNYISPDDDSAISYYMYNSQRLERDAENTVMRPSLITTSRFVHTWRVIKKALFERFASWVII